MEFHYYIAMLWLIWLLGGSLILILSPMKRALEGILVMMVACALLALGAWSLWVVGELNFEIFNAYSEPLDRHGRMLNELGQKYFWLFLIQMASVLLITHSWTKENRKNSLNPWVFRITVLPLAVAFVNPGAVFVAMVANLF